MPTCTRRAGPCTVWQEVRAPTPADLPYVVLWANFWSSHFSENQAPQFFLKCTSAGVPIWCVITVSLITCITFLVAGNDSAEVFFWFVDLTTTALVMTYVMMFITYIGWYRARTAQGMDASTLPYRAPWAPYTAYGPLGLGIFTLFFIGWNSFVPWDLRDFITNYFGVAWGILMFVLWKVIKKTKMVSPGDADLISGKAEIDEECRHWEEGGLEETEKARLAQMNVVRRTWEKMW